MNTAVKSFQPVQHRFYLCLIFSLFTLFLPTLCHSSEPNSEDWHYTLRPGDTLQSVSKNLLNRQHSWTDLVHHNQIDQTDSLEPGSIISIPMHWLKHQPQPASVISISGSAQIKRSGKTQFKVLKQNMQIRVGDEVTTRKGNVLIEFADKSTIRLEEQSSLLFNRLSHYGKTGMVDTRLRLKQGKLSTEVTPLVKGSRYEISTPSAVAAVRGTQFRLESNDNETKLEVVRGEVSFSGQHGSINVETGQGAIIRKASALIERSLLPLAPKPDFAEPTIKELPLTLNWVAQKDAQEYRFQLTDDKNQKKLVEIKHASKPVLKLDQIQNGDYKLTMRALNKQGFGGLDSISNLKVDIATEVPKLLSPADNSVIKVNSPTFSWKVQNPSILSRLIIAYDQEFKNIAQEFDFNANSIMELSSPLNPGIYYWQVKAIAKNSTQSTSNIRKFDLKGILPEIRILSVNYVGDQVGLFWNKLDNVQGYILQVSDSNRFKTILKEQTLRKSRAHLKLKTGKSYFARVKAVGSPLYVSKFGPIKKLVINP